MTPLARLVSEREPDADALERERLGTPDRPYKDARFYGPLERVTLAAIQGTLDHAYTRRPRR